MAPHIINCRSGLPPTASPGGMRSFALCVACHLVSSPQVVAPRGCLFFDASSREIHLTTESGGVSRTICFLPVKDEVGQVADSRKRILSRARKGRPRNMTHLRSIRLPGCRQNDADPMTCHKSSSIAGQVRTRGIVVNAVRRAKERAQEPGGGCVALRMN